jgi:Flp pilus assembly pilin Flp
LERLFKQACVDESSELSTRESAMVKLSAAVRAFLVDEEGATLVEYSLLVALLAAASISILYSFGQNIRGLYSQINNAVGTANAGITSVQP